jgi:muramoyltetrapeptide carboxypeptidase
MIKPKALQKGDTIGIAAPASPFDRLEFEKGLKTIENLGFTPRFREDIFSTHRYLAGDDSRRISELIQHLTDPEVKALFFARGGYGTLRILPHLDLQKLKTNTKIVMGYSDMTPLLTYLHQQLHWVVFHGPVVAKGMGDSFQERGKNSLLRSLTHRDALGEIRSPDLIFLKPGRARGVLVGGCLSLIIATLNTPYEVDCDGKILFLEDVNELPYKIDRMLTQLKLAGKYKKVKGIIFGPFKNSGKDPEEVKEVILDVLRDEKFPVAFGFPSGHMEDMMTITLGEKLNWILTQAR